MVEERNKEHIEAWGNIHALAKEEANQVRGAFNSNAAWTSIAAGAGVALVTAFAGMTAPAVILGFGVLAVMAEIHFKTHREEKFYEAFAKHA